jgi:hypothetical protein
LPKATEGQGNIKECQIGKDDSGGLEEACDRVRWVYSHRGEDNGGTVAAKAVYKGWIRGGRKRKGGL